MLALFIGLGVLPLLALGALGYVRSVRAVEELLATETGAIARRAATELESRYARYESDLSLLAENLETRRLFEAHYGDGADSWGRVFSAADTYLQQVWDLFRVSYHWIELRDTTGAVVYSLGASRAERARADELGGGAAGEGMRFDRPIPDANTSARLGTVVAMARLDQVLPSGALSRAFGRFGYSVVLDREADRVVYHPRRSQLQARASVLVGPDGWDVGASRLAPDSGSVIFGVVDSTRVASFVNLETPAWTVLSTSAVDEFSGPFARTRRVQLALLLLVTAGVFIAFLLLTGRATRSLERLTEAADAVAAGDYSPALPPGGRDEVGRLSAAFTVMVERVDETLRRIRESRHMAAVGGFASRLSHEIRNPLTSIKLNLQRLERHAAAGRMPDECVGPLATSLEEVRRLDGVVRGALSLARMRPLAREACSVHAVLGRAVAAVRPQLEGQEIVVEQDLQAASDTVLGDAEALKGVFLNLFLNAAEAMPDGGRLRISSEVAPGEEDGTRTIRVRVADQGPGVSPEVADKIFEPFFSTKGEGTGFGLPLALSTVEDHGGTLELEEPAPQRPGAVFAVELPLVVAEEESRKR
jgi:signal transduction histidine kinase